MILLGLREAYRPRLLKAPHAVALTVLSFVMLVSWVGVSLLVVVSTGWVALLVSTGGSFVLGIVARALVRPRDVLAQFEEASQRERDALQSALRRSDVRDTLQALGLTPDDLNSLLRRLLLVGVEDSQAAKAVRSPDVIRWYFRRVMSFSEGDALRLALWARYGERPADAD
jgi:hypothetical protein